MAKKGSITVCARCSTEFEQSGRGRPQIFCSDCKSTCSHNELWRVRNPDGFKRYKHAVNVRRKKRETEDRASRPRPDLCEVCGGPPGRGETLHFDHDHASGVFRGWLCFHCNVALGLLKDDAPRLRALADYLDASNRPVHESVGERLARVTRRG